MPALSLPKRPGKNVKLICYAVRPEPVLMIAQLYWFTMPI